MARNFRDYVTALLPPWLAKPNQFGVRFTGGLIGYFSDILAEALGQAMKAGWAKQATSPDDALPSIGVNFNIERVAGETVAEYRARITDSPGAWPLWQEAATVLFAENAMAAFGVDAAQVLLLTRVFLPAGNWSTWTIVLAPPLPWSEAEWGGSTWGTWGTAATWGSSATLAEISGILRLLCKWKSAHEVGVDVVLNYDDHIWGIGDWGAPKTWGTSGIVRWVLGRFWGANNKPFVWGDKETYRPQFDALWGGKIRL